MIETASPKRIRRKAEEILRGGVYPAPEVTILCRPEAPTVRYFSELPALRVIPFESLARRDILGGLRRSEFDVVWMFWTGDSGYLDMKWVAVRMPALFRQVDTGDGHSFKLSRGNLVRFLRIRLRHGRPMDSDLYEFDPGAPPLIEIPHEDFDGEKVLIIQSARPPFILRALDRLKEHPLFRKPRYTLFCRNRMDIVKPMEGHPMLHRIVTHSETKGVWRHLSALRREHFDAVVVFFTGDPSYWKIKYFAFLLGARHKVIFNEGNSCYYFSVKAWLALMSLRREQQLELRRSLGQGSMPPLGIEARAAAVAMTKLLLLPFRFLWLLLNWVRLRLAAAWASG
jgi:hypothetical protein